MATVDYEQFLGRATAGLAALGARQLVPDGYGPGWDSILLLEQPGTSTVYAFTNGTSAGTDELRARLEALAQGIAQRVGVQRGLLPVRAVIAMPSPPHPRALTALAPRTFYQGLRPQTWVADLESGRIYGGRFARDEVRVLIAGAASGAVSGEVLDPSGVAASQREQQQRLAAFYHLMQSRQPFVTYALIAVNVIIFLLTYVSAHAGTGLFQDLGGLPDNTLQTFGAGSPRLIEQGQWWRLVAMMFLHASIPHILFNMVSLAVLGTLAERLYGSAKYLAIYLGAGVIGSLASFGFLALQGHIDDLAVGASGAIFGIAGALLSVRFQASEVIPRRLRERISTSLLPIVILNLAFAAFTPHIDNSAHVGGLLGGVVLSLLLPVVRHVPTAL